MHNTRPLVDKLPHLQLHINIKSDYLERKTFFILKPLTPSITVSKLVLIGLVILVKKNFKSREGISPIHNNRFLEIG